MNKRLTSLLMTVVILLSLLVSAVPASAAPTCDNGLSLSKMTASPGEEFELYWVIPPITAGKSLAQEFKVDFNKDLTVLTEFNPGKPEGEVTITRQKVETANKHGMVGVNYMTDAEGADWSAGMTYTYKFKVADDATPGDVEFKINTYTLERYQVIDGVYTVIDLVPAGYVDTVTLTITAAPVHAESISLDKTATTIYKGASEKLTATVTPADCTDSVEWSSDTPAVATVDSEGNVNAVGIGTAIITAKAGDKTATCTVTVENAPCSHSDKRPVEGKASTCKDKGWSSYRKCAECGQIFDMDGNPISDIPYLPLGSHDFSLEEIKEEALKTPGTCKDKAVYYKSCSVCDAVSADEADIFYGEKDPSNHTGGTYREGVREATCKDEGYSGDEYCRGCDTKLHDGEVLGKAEHNPSDVWSYNDTEHWKECENVVGCGVKLQRGNHVSTGDNVATCESRAVCDVCHKQYGGYAAHNYSTEWSKDAESHWHVCTVCREVKDRAGHTPNREGHATEDYAIVCTVCGYTIEEQLEHTHVFDREVATDAYKVSDATCTEKATYKKSCRCGQAGTETFEYGTPNGHTEGTEWKFDATGHWHICTVAGCGTIIESSKAAHTPDREESTVDDPIKCSVCGYEIAPRVESAEINIPFTVDVKQGGNVAPGKQKFELEIFDIGYSNTDAYTDVTYTAGVDTDGKGSFDGTLTVKGPKSQVEDYYSEGFYVRQKNANAANWTYSDAVWFVQPVYVDDVLSFEIYPATKETAGDETSYIYDRANKKDKMSFENTYTENTAVGPDVPDVPDSPKTGDNSNVILWILILAISGAAVVCTTVYFRKRKA